jgi:hypothetical protein
VTWWPCGGVGMNGSSKNQPLKAAPQEDAPPGNPQGAEEGWESAKQHQKWVYAQNNPGGVQPTPRLCAPSRAWHGPGACIRLHARHCSRCWAAASWDWRLVVSASWDWRLVVSANHLRYRHKGTRGRAPLVPRLPPLLSRLMPRALPRIGVAPKEVQAKKCKLALKCFQKQRATLTYVRRDAQCQTSMPFALHPRPLRRARAEQGVR